MVLDLSLLDCLRRVLFNELVQMLDTHLEFLCGAIYAVVLKLVLAAGAYSVDEQATAWRLEKVTAVIVTTRRA